MGRKIKPFVGDALVSLQKGLFAFLGGALYTLTDSMLKGTGASIKALPDPKDITSPEDFLEKYFGGMLQTVFSGENKNPIALATLLLQVILTTSKYPIDVAGMINSKYLERDARDKIRPQLLDVSSALRATLREYKTVEETNKLLGQHGFTDEDIEIMQKLIYNRPGVQDIINFAVREVYSPGVAERFGQYEGASEVYRNAEKDIKAAGMTQETFDKYWAAHWVLPSVNQGFTMLHREVITEDDLEKLFIALDIMPFWRDKVKAISYNPFTRVDVRRMHKVGVLTDAEVLTSYKDLGYNDEKAQKMTDFTVAINEASILAEQTRAEAAADEAKALTKSDILRMYRIHLLTPDETTQFLSSLNYPPDLVEMLISREDFLRDEDQSNDYIRLYKISYIDGIIDEDKLRSQFGELNLPEEQQQYFIDLWDIEREIKTSVPTKSELFGFFKADIIDEDELRVELRRRGYIDKYIDWYLKALIEDK